MTRDRQQRGEIVLHDHGGWISGGCLAGPSQELAYLRECLAGTGWQVTAMRSEFIAIHPGTHEHPAGRVVTSPSLDGVAAEIENADGSPE